MEDAEHFIKYVAHRFYVGDSPANIIQSLLNNGIKIDVAFLLLQAGKILYEKQ